MGTDDVEVNAAAWDRRAEGALALAWSEGQWRGRLALTAGQSGDALDVAAVGLLRQSPECPLAAPE